MPAFLSESEALNLHAVTPTFMTIISPTGLLGTHWRIITLCGCVLLASPLINPKYELLDTVVKMVEELTLIY